MGPWRKHGGMHGTGCARHRTMSNVQRRANMCRSWLPVAVALLTARVQAYTVGVVSLDTTPVLSYIGQSSSLQQVFNPSFVTPSSGTGNVSGLLVRSQNCSATVGGPCVYCSGSGPKASVITFAKLVSGGTSTEPPVFANIHDSSIVFGPANGTFDDYGTEDPRLAYDAATGTYYLFYTSYGSGASANSVLLSLASTPDPTTAGSWTRHGAVFPSVQGSKSAALLIRDAGPHYLLWGDSSIRITNSSDPTSWPDIGEVLLAPRPGQFDSKLVESGPPPLKLSNGNYLVCERVLPVAGCPWVLSWIACVRCMLAPERSCCCCRRHAVLAQFCRRQPGVPSVVGDSRRRGSFQGSRACRRAAAGSRPVVGEGFSAVDVQRSKRCVLGGGGAHR